MKRTDKLRATVRRDRDVKIMMVTEAGMVHVDTVAAPSLRQALNVFYLSGLMPFGHVAPLIVGNRMSTVASNGAVLDHVALDVYQDPPHQVG